MAKMITLILIFLDRFEQLSLSAGEQDDLVDDERFLVAKINLLQPLHFIFWNHVHCGVSIQSMNVAILISLWCTAAPLDWWFIGNVTIPIAILSGTAVGTGEEE